MEKLAKILKKPLPEIKKCVEETSKVHGVSKNDVINVVLTFSTYLLGLPEEVLQNIMLEMDIQTLGAFCGISKRTRDTCNSQSFWKTKIIRDFGKKSLGKGKDYKLQYKNLVTENEVSLIITVGDLDVQWSPKNLCMWGFVSDVEKAEEDFKDMSLEGDNFLPTGGYIDDGDDLDQLIKEGVFVDEDGVFYNLIHKDVRGISLSGKVYMVLSMVYDFDEEQGPKWHFNIFPTREDVREWIGHGYLRKFSIYLNPKYGMRLYSDFPDDLLETSRQYFKGSKKQLEEYIKEFGYPMYLNPGIKGYTEDVIGTQELADKILKEKYIEWEFTDMRGMICVIPVSLKKIDEGFCPFKS